MATLGNSLDLSKDEIIYLKENKNDTIVIPSGMYHNIINISDTYPLKLYTIYSPKEHGDDVLQEKKPIKSINENIYTSIKRAYTGLSDN